MASRSDRVNIGNKSIHFEEVYDICRKASKLELSKSRKQLIKKSRAYLKERVINKQERLYGINTGFGSLCDVGISFDEIETLQANLVRSHACGVGDRVPNEIVRIIMFLKILNLSTGHSGVRQELIDLLIKMFEKELIPEIFQLGSLGASGDLAPLAHLSLTLIGEGRLWNGKSFVASARILKKHGVKPTLLKAKEGLALLNGTQFSTAYAIWCLHQAFRLYELSNLCAAISIDAYLASLKPFDESLHQIRAHEGQLKTAREIRKILRGSKLQKMPLQNVQDPYAFRCVPQVHGASYDTFKHCEKVVNTEINSVTDNPNVFVDEDKVISGGNFHAQPIALILDFMCIALAELGSISERRTYQLISGRRNLPEFLIKEVGLNSGFMIPQYTAASIASQNKQLCTPASVDSIVSSNGQEDHVSMAANAATKAYRVVQNLERLLAIEFMTAMQALEFRKPVSSSKRVEEVRAAYRKKVKMLDKDRNLSIDIHNTISFLKE